MRFRPHMNAAMGKYYHTKKDYLRDMKRMNLVPSNSPDAKPKKYETKSYKPTVWARDMVRAIENRTDSGGKVHLSTGMIDQLKSRLSAAPKNLRPDKGGYY